MTLLRSSLGLAALGAGLSYGSPAEASPPGDWSVAVERLFGIVRTSIDYATRDSFSSTSISLMSKVGGSTPYSTPRLAIDYITGSSLSFGGAIGFQSNDESSGDSWLLAGRIGYFARPSSSFGLWPRVGLTQVLYEAPVDEGYTALTLEIPLEFLVGGGVAIAVMPHADIGIDGNEGDIESTVTELGLQFGLGVFF